MLSPFGECLYEDANVPDRSRHSHAAVEEVGMKLGVLSRTLIVLSCFWMVGGTFYIAQRLDTEARAASKSFYEACYDLAIEGSPLVGTTDDCRTESDRRYEARTRLLEGGLWGFSASLAGFFLVGCLIVFGLIYGSARWIVAGRRGS